MRLLVTERHVRLAIACDDVFEFVVERIEECVEYAFDEDRAGMLCYVAIGFRFDFSLGSYCFEIRKNDETVMESRF